MRQVRCEQCGAGFPANDMFRVVDRSLCGDCAEEEMAHRAMPEGSVSRQVDLAVCARCGADEGQRELSLVAGAPLCAECRESV